MLKRFVCLANSFKEGGRCLAGIEIDQNDKPVFENKRPKWIRPICNTLHGEVHTHLCSHIRLLEIVEIDIISFPNLGSYHSENALFNESSIRVASRFNGSLSLFCDDAKLIFGNRGKAISEESITRLAYSLMFIKTNKFEVVGRSYDNVPEKIQYRLVFSYNGNEYNFPITDPDFLNKLRINPEFYKNYQALFMSLSITIPWESWYYKLVAGIFPQ